MAKVQLLTTGDVPAVLLRKVRTLLLDAFDGGFSEDDWEHALGGWHAIVTEAGQPIAHAAVTPRIMQIGGRTFRCGYVEAVGTDPLARRSRHGSRAVKAVMDVIRQEFEVGVLSTSRQAFYERLGWERWQGPSFVIRDGEKVRTEQEDDGIMSCASAPAQPSLSLTRSPVVRAQVTTGSPDSGTSDELSAAVGMLDADRIGRSASRRAGQTRDLPSAVPRVPRSGGAMAQQLNNTARSTVVCAVIVHRCTADRWVSRVGSAVGLNDRSRALIFVGASRASFASAMAGCPLHIWRHC